MANAFADCGIAKGVVGGKRAPSHGLPRLHDHHCADRCADRSLDFARHLLLKKIPNQAIDAALFALKASMPMVAHPVMQYRRIFPATAVRQSLIPVSGFRDLWATLDAVVSRPDPRTDFGRKKKMSRR